MMSSNIFSAVSFACLLVIALLSIELLHNFTKQDEDVSKRRLEAPHYDKIPGKFLVRAFAYLSSDIYYVQTEGDSIVTPPEAITWKSGWDFKYYLYSDDGTEAMVVQSTDWGDEKKTVIVFQGTEESEDFWTNIEVSKKKNRFTSKPPDVELHGGFQGSLFETQPITLINKNLSKKSISGKSVIKFIEKKVMLEIEDTNELYLTGHSLGGALAQIMACYMADKYPDIKVTMINFGGPRVGNEEFKIWSNERTNLGAWRYVYDYDMVPRIPTNFMGFDHAGHTFQIWPGDYTSIYWRHTGNEDDGGDYAGAEWYWYYASSFSDHLIETYINHFEKKYNNADYWPNEFQGGTPYPTAAPTVTPTCSASDIFGQILHVGAPKGCYYVQLLDGGILGWDSSDPGCERKDSTNPQILSLYSGMDGRSIYFNDPNRWDGVLLLEESSDVTDPLYYPIDINPTTKNFLVELVVSSCD